MTALHCDGGSTVPVFVQGPQRAMRWSFSKLDRQDCLSSTSAAGNNDGCVVVARPAVV